MGVGDAVGGKLYRPPAGNSDAVGGPDPTYGGLHVGEWL